MKHRVDRSRLASGSRRKRGHSVMWVSDDFRREYATAQAVKLAIIDAAFDACFRHDVGEAASSAPEIAPRNRQHSGRVEN